MYMIEITVGIDDIVDHTEVFTSNAMLMREFVTQTLRLNSVVAVDVDMVCEDIMPKEQINYYCKLGVYTSCSDPGCSIIATDYLLDTFDEIANVLIDSRLYGIHERGVMQFMERNGILRNSFVQSKLLRAFRLVTSYITGSTDRIDYIKFSTNAEFILGKGMYERLRNRRVT